MTFLGGVDARKKVKKDICINCNNVWTLNKDKICFFCRKKGIKGKK